MLQLLPCPHCGQQSLLPQDTSLEASIKCPYCGEQLVLGEAFLQQFRSWEIVDDPAALADLTPAGGIASQLSPSIVVPVPQEGSPQEELRLADSFKTDASSSDANTAAAKASVRPYTHFEYERMRRKQKSPIWSIIPVVLGGLAAFPIALLILWYGLGKDVGDMGPKVAQYAPWIVPKQFHPVVQQSSPRPRKQPPRQGESGLPQLGDLSSKPTPAPQLPESEMRLEGGLAPIEAVEKDVKPDTAVEKEDTVRPDKVDSALGGTASSVAKVEPGRPSLAGDKTVQEDSSSAGEANPSQNLFVAIREAKELLVELDKALDPASADRPAVSADRQKEIFYSAYERLAGLAIVCSQIDKDSPVHKTIREQMLPIARKVQQSVPFQSAFDNVSKGKAAEKSKGDSLGVAMTLEITGVERLQEFWMIAGNHKLVAGTIIEIPRTLAPSLATGQKLFVLGVLVPGDSNDHDAPPTLRVSYLHAL